MASGPPRLSTLLDERIVLRAAIYYAVLGVAAVALWNGWPRFQAAVPLLSDGVGALGPLPTAAEGPVARRAGTLAPTVLLAMASAVLLSLPVAWVYRLTRSKRGYQQSVVQTLLILPMVVAGVVVLVKDSLALAFGLAGIVAAVRFRTSLDDSKDAMYVFQATGVGLAAAVDLPVAAVLSVFFNGVILLLWYTDFGRQPAHLEGRAAERRLEGALSHPTRTGTFVARVDDELFRDMSAEQLAALAERASRRARQNDPGANGAGAARRELRLRLRATDAEAARRAVEPVLEEHAKRFRHDGARDGGDGTTLVEYVLTLRGGAEPDAMLAAVRAAAAPWAVEAEVA